MPNRLVIVNTSPLLYLHQTDCLYLLQRLYKRVTAPPTVDRELKAGALEGVNVPQLDRFH